MRNRMTRWMAGGFAALSVGCESTDSATNTGADGADATDGQDGTAAGDQSDGTDAADGTEAGDATDTEDGTDAVDAADAEDGVDATDGADVTDAADAADASDGVDGGDVAPEPVACVADLDSIEEEEPNDDPDTYNDLGTVEAPGLCVQGVLECGNTQDGGQNVYAYPFDGFVFDVLEGADVTVSLKWSAKGTDADMYVTEFLLAQLEDDSYEPEVILSYAEDTSGLESGTLTLKGKDLSFYLIQLGCWDSPDLSIAYSLSVQLDDSGTDGTDGTDATDLTDGTDVTDGTDATDATDGTDTTDGTDATDGTDGMDAIDGTDAMDATDGTDAMDATDGTDATDATDGTDATDATDGTDATDATDGTDATDVCAAETLAYTASPIDDQIRLFAFSAPDSTKPAVAAEAFTPPTSFSVESVVLPLSHCGDYGSLRVLITGLTAEGVPDLTNVLGSTTALTESFGTGCDTHTDMTFTFTASVPLVAGTNYAIALERTPAPTEDPFDGSRVDWYGGDVPPAFVGASWKQDVAGSWEGVGLVGNPSFARFVAFSFAGEICQ